MQGFIQISTSRFCRWFQVTWSSPPPCHCPALCSRPRQLMGHRSRCNSDKRRTFLRCSSPEPKVSALLKFLTCLLITGAKLTPVYFPEKTTTACTANQTNTGPPKEGLTLWRSYCLTLYQTLFTQIFEPEKINTFSTPSILKRTLINIMAICLLTTKFR